MPRIPADVRREQFIEAAMKVIVEHGVEGATTRRIAQEANAPLASLHYCFRSKEELFVAIWETQLHGMRQRPRAHSEEVAGLGPTAAAELRAIVEFLSTHEAFAIATTDMLFWAIRQDPTLATRAFDLHIDASADYLRSHLRPGDDESLVEPLARMIAAAVDGLSLQWVTFHDRARLEADVEVWAEAMERLANGRATPKRAAATPSRARREPARRATSTSSRRSR